MLCHILEYELVLVCVWKIAFYGELGENIPSLCVRLCMLGLLFVGYICFFYELNTSQVHLIVMQRHKESWISILVAFFFSYSFFMNFIIGVSTDLRLQFYEVNLTLS